MLINEILNHETTPWYHSTSVINAIKILRTNMMMAKTMHPLKGLHIYGVSVTRDKTFANKWGDVIFVLDSRKVKYNNKVIPIDFKNYAKHYKVEKRSNREEFVVGNIKNIKEKTVEILFSTVAEKSDHFEELQDICDSEGIILTSF